LEFPEIGLAPPHMEW